MLLPRTPFVFAIVWLVAGLFPLGGQTVAPSPAPTASPNPLAPDYVAAPLRDWEKRFAAFQFKTLEKDGHTLPYRFYQPPTPAPGKTYPLVLFFHGAGERGSDNRGQFQRFPTVPFWEKYPCFVIAPQCPLPVTGPDGHRIDNRWVDTNFGAASHTMQPQPNWQMALAMDLFEKTVRENPVDPSRLYVTGLSMGGFATWEILGRLPHRFAAAAPVCGGADLASAPQLVDLPLWVFHGADDTTVLPQRSRDMVAAIKAAGGNPKYTEYPGVGHGAWTPTYTNPELWDWLFARQRPANR